jgi:ATP-dependent RNA helicase HelY
VKLSERDVTLALGKVRASPNANEIASAIGKEAAQLGLKTIIFVQQANYAPNTAKKLYGKLHRTDRLTPAEEELWTCIQAEVGGPAQSLIDPTAGALPHNGDMIALERKLAESLFRRSDGANIIIATPTLAQGMNLPAQVAIIAGDKRHVDGGRADLEQHEILNAAGRAGRAGHLANGIVLLIPEPVVGFDIDEQPDREAFEKLRSILPFSDQCVEIKDPLAALLDKIQTGKQDQPKVRYILNRLQAGEEGSAAQEAALTMIRRSFAAFQARSEKERSLFNQKVDALREALARASEIVDGHLNQVAAFSGIPVEPMAAILTELETNLENLPLTVEDWIAWIIDFLSRNPTHLETLFEDDVETIKYIVRGKKKGPPLDNHDFALLRKGLCAWINGQPFNVIEIELGVLPTKVSCCPRARDLILRIANRRLYMIAAAISDITQRRLVEASVLHPNHAALETLAISIRKGYYCPEQVAFAYLSPKICSRVLVHQAYKEKFDKGIGTLHRDYQTALSYVRSRLRL